MSADGSIATEAQARELLAAVEAAYNAADPEAILACFSEHVVAIPTAGQPIRGKAAFASWLGQRLQELGEFSTAKHFRAYQDGCLCVEFETRVEGQAGPRVVRGAEVLGLTTTPQIDAYRQYAYDATDLEQPTGSAVAAPPQREPEQDTKGISDR